MVKNEEKLVKVLAEIINARKQRIQRDLCHISMADALFNPKGSDEAKRFCKKRVMSEIEAIEEAVAVMFSIKPKEDDDFSDYVDFLKWQLSERRF